VNFGLLRQIREESPQSLKVVGFEYEVKPLSYGRYTTEGEESSTYPKDLSSGYASPSLYKEAFSW
jgi:hypothetical protein